MKPLGEPRVSVGVEDPRKAKAKSQQKPQRKQQKTKLLEHDLQKQFFNVCRFHAEVHKDWRYENIFATPNQAPRSFAQANYMRAEGLRAGVPDVFVAVPCGGFPGLWIEFKCPGKKQTEAQQQWFERLRKVGYLCEVVYSATDATELVRNYFMGNIRRLEK